MIVATYASYSVRLITRRTAFYPRPPAQLMLAHIPADPSRKFTSIATFNQKFKTVSGQVAPSSHIECSFAYRA